jgi:GNAT superfamily N-acetyltransferase
VSPGEVTTIALDVVSASTLDRVSLAALFTGVYAGYWHPIVIDEPGLQRMVATYDLDLDASVVAVDGRTPVGLAMLAVRGDQGWVGGMGVLPERRGAGFGELLTRRLLESGRRRGVRHVRLEVLEQNAPAIAIYERVGFTADRDVAVWKLDAPPAGGAAEPAGVAETLDSLAATHEAAPWQRSTATVANMRALGSTLAAARTTSGRAAWAVTDTHASLLQLDAATEDDAAALVRAPFAAGATSLLWLNGPVDGAAGDLLRRAGATEAARQHELSLELR